jgi:hypothetical protein
MALSAVDKSNLRFKAIYYGITLLCLGVSAVALYKAYLNLHIRMLFWVGLGIVILAYIIAALVFIHPRRGFEKFVCHTLALQVVPLCAAVLVFWFVSGREYKPVAGATNQYEVAFNDMQNVQKASAEKNGLPPFESRATLEENYKKLRKEKKLIKISSNSGYVVRRLTHSVPYVVPKVEELLDDIAKSFQEKTKSDTRFVVTSVLRTEEDVEKLQQVNVNASSASCHCNATTIDISYVRFEKDKLRSRTDYDLRLALAKTLHELRAAGRCYVKIEKKQYCYHITVR